MTRHLFILLGLLALLAFGCGDKDGREPDAGDASLGDIIYYEPPVTNPVEDMPVYPDAAQDTGTSDVMVGQE